MYKHRNLKKLVIASAIILVLNACGGGSGGGNTNPTDTDSNSSTINGSASKGMVLGGIVNAYLITDTGEKGEKIAGPAITDSSDGSYELTLSDEYDGISPLIIEVTAASDGSTKMKCDLEICQTDDANNPTVQFGDIYNVNTTVSNFNLSAVFEGTKSSNTVNLTPLTHVAAKFAQNKISKGATPAEAIVTTNAQIGNRFGLGNNLTSQAVIDLTNPTDINLATADTLEYNLKSVGIIQAMLDPSDRPTGKKIIEILESFVNQYIEHGIADNDGAGDADNPDSISQEEILVGARKLLDKIKNLTGIDTIDSDINNINAKLSAEEEEKNQSTDSTPKQGDIPKDVGSEGLIAAKNFVQQVRDFAHSTSDGLKAFKPQITTATDISSDDTIVTIEAIVLAATAITEADSALTRDSALSNYTSGDGVNVAIDTNSENPVFTVNQIVTFYSDYDNRDHSVAVKLSATGNFLDATEDTQDGNLETKSGKVTATLDIIEGVASNEGVRLTINGNSTVSGELMLSEKDDRSSTEEILGNQGSGSRTEESEYNYTLTGLDFALGITIEQIKSSPAMFTGNLSARVNVVDYDVTKNHESSYSYNDEQSSGSAENSETKTVDINNMVLTLSGEFTKDSEQLSATISAAIDGLNGSCVTSDGYRYNDDFSLGIYDYIDYPKTEDCSIQQSNSDYAAASLSLRFSINVNGIADKVDVEANVNRTGMEMGDVEVDITYGGNTLNANYHYNPQDIDVINIVNHNDVILKMTEQRNDSDDLIASGWIKQNGKKYADIHEPAGLPRITFIDGYFESMF